MTRYFRTLAAIVMLMGCVITVQAQTTVKGKVVDADGPLMGATVQVKGSTQGTVTDMDGQFSLETASGRPTLVFRYLGYNTKEVTAPKGGDLGTVEMEAQSILESDVIITGQMAVARKTPVAVSTVMADLIEDKLGTQEFPEVLKYTPGVHANKVGGGYGDSEIYMRGFGNENIAVMINGVPMNDMEWGGIYWSNWAGLSDVTSTMQTQRGLGASKVSAPSVGGTINIVTKTTDAKKGGSISYTMGNDDMEKVAFTVSTGINEKGWGLTLLGAHQTGNGLAQGLDYEGYNYYASLTKRLGDFHTLSLTAFGAPQKHYQRSSKGLKLSQWKYAEEVYGISNYRYNPSYGFDKNGQRKTSEYNEYHKPQISLNHQWLINEKSNLSTAAYVSLGRGNGYSGEANEDYGYSYQDFNAAYYGDITTKYRKADGTFDYGAIQDINEQSEHGSMLIMSLNRNYHDWYGLVSTYSNKLSEQLDFYGGIDMRLYKGTHQNIISDLYNGQYFIDSSRGDVEAANNANATNPAWRYEKLGVGDVVYRDYDSHVMQEGAFFQTEYDSGEVSAFVSGSLNNTSYSRYDRFYYDEAHAQSPTVNFIGFTAKTGANWNINDNHNVFANVGYISRAPFFSYGAFMQATTSNAINENAKNEKVFSVEAGYGFHNEWLNVNLNAYYTKWMDKAMTKYGTLDNQQEFYMNMTGVDALHKGIELEGKARVARWLDIKAMFSIGDWKWDSDAIGYAYDEHGNPLTADGMKASGIGAEDHAWAKVMLKGIRVGGSAQTTAAASADFKFTKDVSASLDYNYLGRNYSYYSFSGSNLAIGKELYIYDPWEIPAAHVIDVNARYRFKINGMNATLRGNVNNLLGNHYITKAWNPSGISTVATADNISCFINMGRTYSISLKLNF